MKFRYPKTKVLWLTVVAGPIMKSTSVVIGLLVGCIISGATNYFDKASIDSVSPIFSCNCPDDL